MPTSTLRPACRTEAPPPTPPVFDPEELAQCWIEHIPTADDADLTLLLNVVGGQPSQERSVVQNIALARAKQELTRRGLPIPAIEQRPPAPAAQPAPATLSALAVPPTPVAPVAPAATLRPYRPMLRAFEQQLPPVEPKKKRSTW